MCVCECECVFVCECRWMSECVCVWLRLGVELCVCVCVALYSTSGTLWTSLWNHQLWPPLSQSPQSRRVERSLNTFSWRTVHLIFSEHNGALRLCLEERGVCVCVCVCVCV